MADESSNAPSGLHGVVMKRGSPSTMKTCLPTRCRGGPAGPPRADAWVGPYLSFSEQNPQAMVFDAVSQSIALRDDKLVS